MAPTDSGGHRVGSSIHVEMVARSAALEDFDAAALVTYVAQEENVEIGAVSVILADHAAVHNLNKAHLGHDYHTDVLAFPYVDPPDPTEGDIYVDVDTARERHAEFDATFQEELARYVIHGFLHLIGYTDKSTEARRIMKKRENRYLRETAHLWEQR